MFRLLFHGAEDFFRYVDARGPLKAQVTHIAVNFHEERAILRLDKIDARKGKAQKAVGF